ncbi:hypothetical protein BK820_11635 [Acinetobacter sp. LCT-H3]|nr:hypothetical protein BK820_11635 [Acinetobacter sp. LCT-H3]
MTIAVAQVVVDAVAAVMMMTIAVVREVEAEEIPRHAMTEVASLPGKLFGSNRKDIDERFIFF